MKMKVLISGASVAGPVLAYWLTEYGFEVTVVERAPTLRKTGGHAVDLFRPAMQIVTKMGLLEQIRDKTTGTETLVIHRPGRKPVTADLRKIYTAVSDDHLEIMRDDLSEIFYDATRALNIRSPTPSRRSLTTATSLSSTAGHADST